MMEYSIVPLENDFLVQLNRANQLYKSLDGWIKSNRDNFKLTTMCNAQSKFLVKNCHMGCVVVFVSPFTKEMNVQIRSGKSDRIRMNQNRSRNDTRNN